MLIVKIQTWTQNTYNINKTKIRSYIYEFEKFTKFDNS